MKSKEDLMLKPLEEFSIYNEKIIFGRYSIADYHNSVSKIGPKAAEWDDKPHRIVFDLCRYILIEEEMRRAQPQEAVNKLPPLPKPEYELKKINGKDCIVFKNPDAFKYYEAHLFQAEKQNAALSQEAKPVAWRGKTSGELYSTIAETYKCFFDPLYAAPPSSQALDAVQIRNDALEAPKSRLENLLVDVAALLGSFVEDGIPLKRSEAREVLRRVRALKSQSQPAATKYFTEVIDALKFYAEGHHFVQHDPLSWDTVSGEPTNFQEDEAGTATVEDGSIAKLALDNLSAPSATAVQEDVESLRNEVERYRSLLLEMRAARPGGCYFYKWIPRIDAAIASQKGGSE